MLEVGKSVPPYCGVAVSGGCLEVDGGGSGGLPSGCAELLVAVVVVVVVLVVAIQGKRQRLVITCPDSGSLNMKFSVDRSLSGLCLDESATQPNRITLLRYSPHLPTQLLEPPNLIFFLKSNALFLTLYHNSVHASQSRRAEKGMVISSGAPPRYKYPFSFNCHIFDLPHHNHSTQTIFALAF